MWEWIMDMVDLLIDDPDKEIHSALEAYFRKYGHFGTLYATNDPRMKKALTLCEQYDSIQAVDFKVRVQGVERFALL
jgi:hypothetical protein